MASPETTTTQQPPINQPFDPDTRTCRLCGDTKDAKDPAIWPHKKKRPSSPYKAYGQICKACDLIRKQKYDKTRDRLTKSRVVSNSVVPKGNTDETRKALTAVSKLDVAAALKTGAMALNELAPGVMARIIEYVEDPDHEHHLWALELLAQRILPRKLYEELGGRAAGVGAIGDRRPTFVLNVLPAGPVEPRGRVTVVQEAEIIEERTDEEDATTDSGG